MHVLAPLPEAPAGIWQGAHLDDESLVESARQPGGGPALDELLRRFTASTGRLVNRLAVRSGFQHADCMDAQQEAVFWILEAIRQYRADDQARTRSCRFRSFLHRVVTVRFIDYFRRLRRDRQLGRPASAAAPSAADANGPELTDLRTCVDRELDRLGPGARFLWRLLAQGVALRQAATKLGISYDMAKRQRRDLLARLRVALAD